MRLPPRSPLLYGIQRKPSSGSPRRITRGEASRALGPEPVPQSRNYYLQSAGWTGCGFASALPAPAADNRRRPPPEDRAPQVDDWIDVCVAACLRAGPRGPEASDERSVTSNPVCGLQTGMRSCDAAGARLAAVLQGPVFLQEPPHRADFSNSTGVVLPCSAHGNPAPTLRWQTGDGAPALEVPGLRSVLPNGSLLLAPFSPRQFRPDVHTAAYHCVASNSVGTAVSRRVAVRAAVAKQQYEAQVYDEYVVSGNTAVFRCHVPAFVRDHVTVTGWLRARSQRITPDISAGGRFSVLATGELHIQRASLQDAELGPYRCETTHKLSGEVRVSSAAGRLVVTEARGSVAPRVTDSHSHVRARVRQPAELPCAAQAFPLPTYTWYRGAGNAVSGPPAELQLGERVRQVGGSLYFRYALLEDSGRYTCLVNNSVGAERVVTDLLVTAPLSTYMSPQLQTVDAGQAASLNCTTEGHPQLAVSWLKDGRPLATSPRVQLLGRQALRIQYVEREDAGMYQCFVSNNEESAQGTAQINLGGAAPVLVRTFSGATVSAGSAWTAQCEAAGWPAPSVQWQVDGAPLPAGDPRLSLAAAAASGQALLSELRVARVRPDDAGEYACVAANAAGSARHAAHLRVLGPPHVKPMRDRVVAAGTDAVFVCRVAGFPISEIRWLKDGKTLPENHRHLVFPNGTLVIRNIHKSDNAGYVCVASNPDGQTSRSKLNVQVMEAPAIDPIPTKSDLQEGMRIHLNCVVTKGDFPITFRWLKDGSEIPPALAVTEKSLDEYSRALTFNSLSVLHSGNYTCQASNAVATTNHTTLLVVNVPPSWKVEPKDSESLMGQNLLVSCAAEGSPKPTIRWTRESGMPPSTYEDLSQTMNNYRILENGSLWIQNIHPENKGYYSCQATNGIGMGLNKIIYITVHVPATFSSPVQNVTVVKAGVATLDCVAKGDKPISINWFLQGQPFDPSQHPRAEVSEESLEFGVHSRLLIKNVNRDDSSSFICQATNHFGSDRSDFHLIVQETPGPPTNVHVTGHTSRSVNLTWEHSYDGNSPVSVYIIQYKSTMVSSWQKNVQQIIVDAEQTSASVNDLLPAHTYQLRVLARNSLGVSNGSSIITITTAEEVPGGPPRDIHVQARNSETLLVTWKPPEEHLHHGEIMGYYIGYRTANSSEPFHYKTYEVIPGMELRNILSGLRKFTEYSVLVQAYNRAGAGPRSEEVLAMTDEDVPGSPPSEVHCTALSSQSILVVWSSPPTSDINGILLGYRVIYRTVTEWDDISTPSEQTTQVQKLEIFGLQRYCNYSIEVKAFTRKGDGVPSRPIFCRTQEDVPGAPDDIKALVMDSRTLLISWRPPRFPNGVIVNYKVYIQSLEGASPPLEQFEVPPSQTHYTLTHLSPQRRYEMKVSATTAAGEGVPSTSVVQAPSTNAPARIASFGHKMKIARGEELQLPCLAVGQPPPRREWFRGAKSIQEDNHLRINSEWTLLIPAVKLSDTGNYTCSAENLFGKDEITYILLVQVPLAPTDFEVSKSTVSSISLSWKSSLSTTNTVQGYYLNYKREFGEWEKIKLSAEENDFTLDGLQCGTKYQFYLQAFNQLGQSAPSETITSHTQGTAPIAPSKNQLIRVNSTSISLNVGSWGTGGCPITTLVVEYKPKQQHEWTLVSNNLKYQQIDFPVLDLSPETWYTLRMTAHNSAGSTVSNYEFITLTNSGAIVEPDLIIHSGYKYNHFYNDLGVIIPVITSLVTVIVAGVGIFLYFRRKQESLPDNKFVGTASEKSCDVAPTGGTSAGIDQKVSGCTMNPSSPRTTSVDREEPLYLPEPVPPSTPASTDTVNPYATFRLPPDAENLPAYDNYSDSVYMKIKKKSQQINADGDWVPLHSLYQAHRY